ncbi:uncharacterized protein LOC123704356 [Colias croceus]|uniref:uncharacterized protein LOC123704356 n=1 Tax=Colias crocea TaxID=72248 RepID=UPI001E27CB12|nr:uncharacterized protein LOC123704356 [Colias croceus]
MLSKLLRPVSIIRHSLHSFKMKHPNQIIVRNSGDYIPATQYDIPIPKRLHILYVLRVYWETIPLFAVTMTSCTICVLSCIWATLNKVDVVYTTHSRDCISRTMDLRNPSVHKIIIINQRYEPWPEMQDVLDKMTLAQKRALMRAQTCKHA